MVPRRRQMSVVLRREHSARQLRPRPKSLGLSPPDFLHLCLDGGRRLGERAVFLHSLDWWSIRRYRLWPRWRDGWRYDRLYRSYRGRRGSGRLGSLVLASPFPYGHRDGG